MFLVKLKRIKLYPCSLLLVIFGYAIYLVYLQYICMFVRFSSWSKLDPALRFEFGSLFSELLICVRVCKTMQMTRISYTSFLIYGNALNLYETSSTSFRCFQCFIYVPLRVILISLSVPISQLVHACRN